MARRKRTSKTLEKADRRFASMQSIDPELDLGNGLSVDIYSSMIDDARNKLAAYNTALSLVDKAYSVMMQSETALADFSEQMLLGVATRYGKKSDEYEMAGGVRKVSRKGQTRSNSSSATTPAVAPTI